MFPSLFGICLFFNDKQIFSCHFEGSAIRHSCSFRLLRKHLLKYKRALLLDGIYGNLTRSLLFCSQKDARNPGSNDYYCKIAKNYNNFRLSLFT